MINNPEDPSAGTRSVPFSRVLYIERDDFMENPPKKFFRLSPGKEVRLRCAYFITCTDVVKDAEGEIVELRCTYDPATRGGDAPDGRRVKATLHWVSAAHAVPAEVRLYDRLFRVPFPGARNVRDDATTDAEPAPAHHVALAGEESGDAAEDRERDFLDDLNPASKRVITAYVEPALALATAEERFQFERHGYFVADLEDHRAGRPVFNRTVTLRDSWTRK